QTPRVVAVTVAPAVIARQCVFTCRDGPTARRTSKRDGLDAHSGVGRDGAVHGLSFTTWRSCNAVPRSESSGGRRTSGAEEPTLRRLGGPQVGRPDPAD